MIIFKHKWESKILPKLEKLARRATKLNLDPITWEVLPAPSAEIRPYNNTILGPEAARGEFRPQIMAFNNNSASDYIYLVPQVEVTINGLVPVLADWSLVAKIEHNRELDTNLIHCVPGISFDSSPFRDRRTCDHCNTDRFRNNTFILQSVAGELKQVGGNCLADYLRSQSYADYIMQLGTFLDTWNEPDPSNERDIYSMFGGYQAYPTERVITLAFACIRQFGFVSGRNEFNIPTKFRVQDHLDGTKGCKIEEIEADKSQAILALDWIKAQGDESDYIRNLKLLSSLDYLECKHLGYVVSLPAAYLKAMEQEIFKSKAPKPPSARVGTIGGKVELTVTIDKLRTIETEYGYSTLVIMTDDKGNDLTWFASRRPDGIDEGIACKIKGTVKDHAEYKGRIQTKLTRCKIS